MSKNYLENVKFLIVEDNEFMRRLIREMLKAFRVQDIREAHDGSEALDVMKAFAPDIVIADWEMQPLNGIEFVKQIRSDEANPNRYVPVIMLSAHSERGRIIAARDAGIHEFLVKPVSAKDLYARIVSVIENPRPFVKSGKYFGPDRRRTNSDHRGPDRRQNDVGEVGTSGSREDGGTDGKAAPDQKDTTKRDSAADISPAANAD